ncbi:MAG: hypothetical protein K6A72_09035 [Lachnospiraceae bacterium]|nr:hypothetical protein [Lachnospiraceae bacterium]
MNLYTLDGAPLLDLAHKNDEDGKWHYSVDLNNSMVRGCIVKESEDKKDNALFHQIKTYCKEPRKESKLDTQLVIVDFGRGLFSEKPAPEDFGEQDRKEGEEKCDTESAQKRFRYFDKLRDLFANGIELTFPSESDPEKGPEKARFVPFIKSQSMARHSKITFIREELYHDIRVRLDLGLKAEQQAIGISKFYAYEGLYLSDSERIKGKPGWLSEETVIVVEDGEWYPDKDPKWDPEDAVPYITNLNNVDLDGEKVSIPVRSTDLKDAEPLAIGTIFDGEGLISEAYADIIRKELGYKEVHSFQIRLPFGKGMLHEVDFHSFLKDYGTKKYGSYWIKDVFGIERDLNKAQIIMTASMLKAWKYLKNEDMNILITHVEQDEEGKEKLKNRDKLVDISDDPMEAYFYFMNLWDHSLYIANTDRPYLDRRLTRLNYQYLNTMDIKPNELESLIDKHREYVNDPILTVVGGTGDVIETDEAAVDDWTEDIEEYEEGYVEDEEEYDGSETFDDTADKKGKTSIKSNSSEEIPEDVENEDEEDDSDEMQEERCGGSVWMEAVRRNSRFKEHPYVKKKLQALSKKLISDIAFGRMQTEGEVRYLSRDLMYFLKQLAEKTGSTAEMLKKLDDELLPCCRNEGEYFYMPQGDKGVRLKKDEYYPILRNPHLSRNEQCALRAYIPGEDSLRNRYFGHLKGVLMVSEHSFAPSTLGGADFDGDIVKLFAAKELRNAVLRGSYDMVGEYESCQVYHRKEPIINIEPIPVKELKYVHTDWIHFDVIYHSFSSQVGLISNLAVQLGQKQYGNNNEEEREKYLGKLSNLKLDEDPEKDEQIKSDIVSNAWLSILTGLEIDACKTGRHPNTELGWVKTALKKEKTTENKENEKDNNSETDTDNFEYLKDFKKPLDKILNENAFGVSSKKIKDDGSGNIKFSKELRDKKKIEIKAPVSMKDAEGWSGALQALPWYYFDMVRYYENAKEMNKDKSKQHYFRFENVSVSSKELEDQIRRVEDERKSIMTMYRWMNWKLENARTNEAEWKKRLNQRMGTYDAESFLQDLREADLTKEKCEEYLKTAESSDFILPFLYYEDEKKEELQRLVGKDLADKVIGYSSYHLFLYIGIKYLWYRMLVGENEENLGNNDAYIESVNAAKEKAAAESKDKDKPSEKKKLEKKIGNYEEIGAKWQGYYDQDDNIGTWQKQMVKYRDLLERKALVGRGMQDNSFRLIRDIMNWRKMRNNEKEKQKALRMLYKIDKNGSSDLFWKCFEPEVILEQIISE